MNINTIAKATIKEITHKRNSTLTPLLYFEIFCKEAQKLNLKIEDCELVSHYKEKLNPTFKEHADKYNIRHINELITFLIGNLNRLNLNQLQERHFSLVDLLTKILRTHEILDHNGVKELSRKTNALLERVHTAKDLDSMRNEWVHLIVLSKESYKDKLKKFVNIEKDDDIDSITEKIIPLLEKEKRCKHIDNLIKLIFYSIEPSLTNSNQENYKELHEQVEKLKNVLDKDPYQIYNLRVQEKVEELFEKRIDFDKGQELKTVKEFNHIIETMLTSMNKTFESQDPVQKNIDEVKQYLKELKDNSFNEEKKNSIFETLNSKIDELSGHKTNFFSNIKEYTNKLFDMGEKIKNLEKELKKSQKNENTDHLTKINNKRALDQYSHDLDARYRRYQENFSMVVMDLDFFSHINETYGHDAGDLILVHFAKLLKDNVREIDIVSRYGGEEFIALLPKTDLNGAYIFAEKFRDLIEKTRFIYKNIKIHITFSAGISERTATENFSDMFIKAEENLDVAKNDGRNKIIPKIEQQAKE